MQNDVDDDDSLWCRRFDFEDGSSNCVEEEWNAGIGGTVWEGGVLLARFLSSPLFASLEGLPRGRQLRAIELGCGVSALPCLVMARMEMSSTSTSSPPPSASPSPSPRSSARAPLFSEIYATDIDECLPGLEANARKNLDESLCCVEVVSDRPWETEEVEKEKQPPPPPTTTTIPPATTPPSPQTAPTTSENRNKKTLVKLLDLDWRLFPRAAPHLRAPFDVVLVADAVYVSGQVPALVEAMRSVSGTGSVVLLAYYLRSAAADAEFWPRVEAAFDVGAAIPAASFGCEGADKGGEEQQRRGLFRLRKRSEGDYERLEEERRRRKSEEGELGDGDGDGDVGGSKGEGVD